MTTLAMSNEMQGVLRSLIGEAPLILVTLVGGLFTFMRWSQLGKGALPALAGCICLLFLSLIVPLHYAFVIPKLIEQANGEPERIETLLMFSHLLITLVLALGVGLLLLSTHLGRQAPDPTPR